MLVLIVFAYEFMQFAYSPHGTQLRPVSIISGFRTLIFLVVLQEDNTPILIDLP